MIGRLSIGIDEGMIETKGSDSVQVFDFLGIGFKILDKSLEVTD